VYFTIKKKILCALITSTLKKGQLHEIMRLFQEDSVVTTKFVAVGIEPPRYIIGTTSVISQGLTLTKARYLVQLDSKWMMSTQNQAKGRIWHIMQTRLIITYNIICTDFNIEKVVDNRQLRRWRLFDKMLESQKLNVYDLTQDGFDVKEFINDENSSYTLDWDVFINTKAQH